MNFAARRNLFFAAWVSIISCYFTLTAMAAGETLDLNGDWQVAQTGDTNWLPARIPGCIHTDLLAAGKIPDPFFRDNESQVQWIGETNWTYRRTFEVSAATLARDRVLLRCEGLDTLATVRINGRELGQADNMFRIWEFDAKPLLVAGQNEIVISFASTLPVMRQRNAERKLFEWSGPHEPTGRAYVRKEPCNFGWDWGPVLITCGIWRNIEITAFDQARLSDVVILQDHSVKGQVQLTFNIAAEITNAPALMASIRVLFGQQVVAQTVVLLTNGIGGGKLTIDHPQLWWPAGMGGQPLYQVQVELQDTGHVVLDRMEKRIGLRTVELFPPYKTNSLRFAVNGVTFFAKGANWIPADPFPNRVSKDRLRRYVRDAVAVNMNMLRFWGGGYYEDPELFDACDEMGILVWLDFKFGCSSYPAFDESFMENVRAEVRDNVRQLRHHPSIAVWCGNNEISLMTQPTWSTNGMGKADYDRLFSGLIGGEVKALAPQALYVPGSPEVGDIHSWQVWHGDKPFESYRGLNGFLSEFGFQSFPEPATVRTYTTEADRASVLTPVMKWHQRSAGDGNQKISDTMARYFQPPKDFESALWLSQILQGYGIKIGAESWRQNQPQSMGCIYWQYNDCWPVASWSSVDYYGRWKALHYLARRFYAPVLVSGLEDVTNQSVAVSVTSDLLTTNRGQLTWEVTDPAGRPLLKESETIVLAPQSSRRLQDLDLRKLVSRSSASNLLVWLKIEVPGQPVSENLVTLVRPKDLALVEPGLRPVIKKYGDQFLVTLSADKPALWTWLSLKDANAVYSDNFIHVRPKSPAQITVTPEQPMTDDEFTRALQVRSLIDTYKPTRKRGAYEKRL